MTAERVLEELGRLAFFDIRCLFDESGNLKPLHTLTDERAGAVAGLEVFIGNAAPSYGKTARIVRLKIRGKLKRSRCWRKYFTLLAGIEAGTGFRQVLKIRGKLKRSRCWRKYFTLLAGIEAGTGFRQVAGGMEGVAARIATRLGRRY